MHARLEPGGHSRFELLRREPGMEFRQRQHHVHRPQPGDGCPVPLQDGAVLGPLRQLRPPLQHPTQLRHKELQLRVVRSFAPQRAIDVEHGHASLLGQHLGRIEEHLDGISCRSWLP